MEVRAFVRNDFLKGALPYRDVCDFCKVPKFLIILSVGLVEVRIGSKLTVDCLFLGLGSWFCDGGAVDHHKVH